MIHHDNSKQTTLSYDTLSKKMLQLYTSCTLCPRQCRVNRRAGITGVCKEKDTIRIASVCLHMGEEPILSGTNGSGTVFFTGCTLQCGFCQNYQISREGNGTAVSVEECGEIFCALQERGAHNVNLVTGTHFIPGIILALVYARKQGLTIPVLWNSSGFEEEESLALLAPFVDIWVPDMKTLQSDLSKRICGRTDYPDKAKKALLYMHKQKVKKIDHGLMKSGMILRHLVLPGEVSSTKEVLSWYRDNCRDNALLSLMFQYIPLDQGKFIDKGDFSRFVTHIEFDEVLAFLEEIGIDEGFIQEPVEKSDWTPDFTKDNPFPTSFAQPVWHFKKGFIR